MRDKLNKPGLTSLSQLKLTLNDNDQTNELIADASGLSINKTNTWRIIFQTTILHPGSVDNFDYHTAENPYMSRYGNDREGKTGSLDSCRGKVSINKLIDHMFPETKKIFRGMIH